MWPWDSREHTSTKPAKESPWQGVIPRELEPLFGPLEVLFVKAESSLDSVPRLALAVGCFTLGGIVTTALVRFHGHRFKRLRNADWLTPDVLDGKRVVKGVVTRVGDGDNFRLYHTPIFGGHRWPLKFRTIPTTRAALVSNTLHVRLAGVDAPEASHFGKPAQPYAAESLQWLTNKILNRTVYCQLVRRDQYSRVANVFLPVWWKPFSLGQNVSLEMLKAGWATVYSQSGAEYGAIGEEEFKRQESKAKAARVGMWVNGELQESPAEYKKRIGSPAAQADSDLETGTDELSVRKTAEASRNMG
ncbi:nuclease [Ephemerocybe angulata]|uniref:Nuclease n=1 Tax=Ephemerocybe angulata TaxID=980116 RepID=A0A8H6M096_9AGAR|nr:nuclease [Tulosesus angulatus]